MSRNLRVASRPHVDDDETINLTVLWARNICGIAYGITIFASRARDALPLAFGAQVLLQDVAARCAREILEVIKTHSIHLDVLELGHSAGVGV